MTRPQKYFYKLCMHLTDPEQVAAFNSKFFLQGFLCDYRKNKDSLTFIEDQRDRMRKYDSKVWATALLQAEQTPVVDMAPAAVENPPTLPPRPQSTSLPTNPSIMHPSE